MKEDVPNTYQAHMPGDDTHLPYLGQMAMMEVDEDEEVLTIDSNLMLQSLQITPEMGY